MSLSMLASCVLMQCEYNVVGVFGLVMGWCIRSMCCVAPFDGFKCMSSLPKVCLLLNQSLYSYQRLYCVNLLYFWSG